MESSSSGFEPDLDFRVRYSTACLQRACDKDVRTAAATLAFSLIGERPAWPMGAVFLCLDSLNGINTVNEQKNTLFQTHVK